MGHVTSGTSPQSDGLSSDVAVQAVCLPTYIARLNKTKFYPIIISFVINNLALVRNSLDHPRHENLSMQTGLSIEGLSLCHLNHLVRFIIRWTLTWTPCYSNKPVPEYSWMEIGAPEFQSLPQAAELSRQSMTAM